MQARGVGAGWRRANGILVPHDPADRVLLELTDRITRLLVRPHIQSAGIALPGSRPVHHHHARKGPSTMTPLFNRSTLDRPLPPIDTAVPARLETATFAFG